MLLTASTSARRLPDWPIDGAGKARGFFECPGTKGSTWALLSGRRAGHLALWLVNVTRERVARAAWEERELFSRVSVCRWLQATFLLPLPNDRSYLDMINAVAVRRRHRRWRPVTDWGVPLRPANTRLKIHRRPPSARLKALARVDGFFRALCARGSRRPASDHGTFHVLSYE